MRIDLFVLQHLNHLDGKVKLASNPSDVAIPNYVDPSRNNNQSINHHTKYDKLSLKDTSVESNDNSIMQSSVLSDSHVQDFEMFSVCNQQMIGKYGGLASTAKLAQIAKTIKFYKWIVAIKMIKVI